MNLQTLLERSACRHDHVCPRQILGVRIGLLALKILDLPVGENPKKRLLTILESDGCFADGVEVATGCTVGHRTLRVEDFGKVAATFLDIKTSRAIRVAPRLDIRERACSFVPEESRRYYAQMQAYQLMSDEDLLTIQDVSLMTSIEHIVSRPGMRVNCEVCGEEIMNEREVNRDGLKLCRACAGDGYYQTASHSLQLSFAPEKAVLEIG